MLSRQLDRIGFVRENEAVKHKGIYMRSTFDLPDDLMKQAKIAAVERGITLRDLVAEGLRHVLKEKKPPGRQQLKLPVVKMAADAPLLRMSPQQLKKLLEDEDIEHGLAVHR